MKKLLATGLLLVGVVAGTGTLMAHHSFSAEFDRNQKIKLEGVVTKVEWTNPHVWIYFNAKDADGKVTNWGAELGPPHGLQGRGWRRNTLEIGSKITVEGSKAKNGSSRVNAQTITLAATGGRPGETLDANSSQNDKETK